MDTRLKALASASTQPLLSRPLLWWVTIAFAAVLAGARFVQLSADFPVGLTGLGVLLTDEGWWSRNAVALVREGHWYIDDGYNPIVNLPVVPLMQVLWFKLFGVSLATARSLSAVCLLGVSVITYRIACRTLTRPFALLAPLLILSNYAIFSFSRLALLEMPMILLILLSLHLTIGAPAWYKTSASGATFTLAVLAKTTALFATPLLLWAVVMRPFSVGSTQSSAVEPSAIGLSGMGLSGVGLSATRLKAYWQQHGKATLARALPWIAIWGLSAIAIYGLYYWLLVSGHPDSFGYFDDFNIGAKVHDSIWSVLEGPFRVLKYSFQLYPLLLPALLLSLGVLFKCRARNPLFHLALLWTVLTFGGFSASNYVAPRYLTVLIVPMALAIPAALEVLLRRSAGRSIGGSASRVETTFPLPARLLIRRAGWRSSRALSINARPILLSLVCLSIVLSLSRIALYQLHPRYTFVNMAKTVEQYVKNSQADDSLPVMGHFADTLALTTGIRAVNDQMGFRTLNERLDQFEPVYYLHIGDLSIPGKGRDPDIVPTLQQRYQLILLDRFAPYSTHRDAQPVFFYQLMPKI